MSEDIKTSKGKLYIVSTPIGNKDDFTIRAMNSLKRCDFVICEEMKVGARTLKQLNLSKDLIPLNEHNEVEATNEILDRIIKGEKACLISDDGTPLIADPGNHFIKQALFRNVEIEVVPGVTSILTALVRSGFATDQFVFAGFVGRKTEEKFQDVRDLSREKRTVIILETPYRLASTLEVLNKIMPNRRAYIGMNLTHPYETHHYGTFEELYNKLKDLEIKAEFVICFEGSTFTNFHKKDDFTQEKSFNRDDFESSPQRDESGSYNHDRSGSSRDNRSGGYSRDNRSSGGYNKDRRSSGSRDNRGSYSRDRNSEGGERRDGFSRDRDNRDWDKKKEFSGDREGGFKKREFSGDREGGYKKREFSGDREGGYKKKEFGSRDGGFKKKEFSGDRRDSFKRKEYGDDNRKSYDKPKSFNFSDDDFEKSGPFSNDWEKSPVRRSDSKPGGDRRDFNRGDRKESKFGSKSGGKFGGSKFGSKSGSSKSSGKFGGSKFGKRSGGSKGRK